MPDPTPSPTVVADLRCEVSDHRGSTTAYLHNDERGLVIDVGEPAVLVRTLPRGMVSTDLLQHLAGLSFRVRSDGVELATISVTHNGGTRVRPTVAGTAAAVRLLAHERPAWVVATAAVLLGAVAALGRSLLNRR